MGPNSSPESGQQPAADQRNAEDTLRGFARTANENGQPGQYSPPDPDLDHQLELARQRKQADLDQQREARQQELARVAADKNLGKPGRHSVPVGEPGPNMAAPLDPLPEEPSSAALRPSTTAEHHEDIAA